MKRLLPRTSGEFDMRNVFRVAPVACSALFFTYSEHAYHPLAIRCDQADLPTLVCGAEGLVAAASHDEADMVVTGERPGKYDLPLP